MDLIFPILGIALVVAGLSQFGLWTAASIKRAAHGRKKHEAELQLLRAEIFEITRKSGRATNARDALESKSQGAHYTDQNATVPSASACRPGEWVGFRKFQVVQLSSETVDCKSVYLSPVDEKPLPEFLPGQHLTLRFSIAGVLKPVVRCYTLSDSPGHNTYRITVKGIVTTDDSAQTSAGLVSNFVNRNLQIGEFVEAKNPSGSFFLVPGNRPIVLLAGGVGVTPMMCILRHLTQANDGRQVLLVYGVRNGREHIFKRQLAEIAAAHDQVHVVNCYSQPLVSDHPNQDFHIHGFVSTDVLKRLLPSCDYEFYLCGPPPFMESVYQGLMDWGVPRDQVRFEAFGPSSLKRLGKNSTESVESQPGNSNSALNISFAKSGTQAEWHGQHENLLQFLEESNIVVDSGCRAGSCGTCATRLLKGSVQHQDHVDQACEDGWCLPCVAVPTTELELDI